MDIEWFTQDSLSAVWPGIRDDGPLPGSATWKVPAGRSGTCELPDPQSASQADGHERALKEGQTWRLGAAAGGSGGSGGNT